jgi:hypothetical protein
MEMTRLPLALGVTVTALLGGVWLLLAGPSQDRPAWTPDQGTLSPADRDVLAAAPVGPGDAPAGPDPSVDLTDPKVVAAAYVAAGYSVRDTDAGRTNRRATPYAAPNTPPHTIGVLVLAPPPPGHAVSAWVTDVTQVSGEPTDSRRGYLVGYRTAEGPHQADAQSDCTPPARCAPRLTRYLLLARQFDGRWLVAGDTADAQVGEP